jgi:hypothetical protein
MTGRSPDSWAKEEEEEEKGRGKKTLKKNSIISSRFW